VDFFFSASGAVSWRESFAHSPRVTIHVARKTQLKLSQ
jgi:hypothetical protein